MDHSIVVTKWSIDPRLFDTDQGKCIERVMTLNVDQLSPMASCSPAAHHEQNHIPMMHNIHEFDNQSSNRWHRMID
jgi:hypothetical protein